MKIRASLIAGIALLASVLGTVSATAGQGEIRMVVNIVQMARPGSSAVSCADGATDASEYSLASYKVTSARTANVNTSSLPSSLSSSTAASALNAAFGEWGPGVPATTVALGGSSVTRAKFNGVNDIAFGRLGGRTLAQTTTWYNNQTLVVVESDMIFNLQAPWFQAGSEGSGCTSVNAYDFQATATHEIGHTLGLLHPNPGTYETMYYAIGAGELYKRSLGLGDKAGRDLIY